MPATLTSRIPEIIGALPVRAEGLAMAIAEETAQSAAALAPVASGALRDSIEARRGVSGSGIGVYAAWYWFFLEFGTVNAPAHPYMTPAFEAAYLSIYSQARKAFSLL